MGISHRKQTIISHIVEEKKTKLNTGCSRIYDPILKFHKLQTRKDSTKTHIFSESL